MKDSDRKAFEAWFSQRNSCDEWVYNPFSRMEFNDIDAYSCSTVSVSWEAWQAAKAKAIPDGFVLVPKEPTQELLNKMQDFFVGAFENGLTGGQSIHCAYKALIEAQEKEND